LLKLTTIRQVMARTPSKSDSVSVQQTLACPHGAIGGDISGFVIAADCSNVSRCFYGVQYTIKKSSNYVVVYY
jgi:hypothetical protein